jgi:hypothetical protein
MVITLHALPPVSFYTEPANDNHFAETRGSLVLVRISGLGAAGTTCADPADGNNDQPTGSRSRQGPSAHAAKRG